ncbi:hypothetical protein ACQB6R_14130 [Propionibacteriaceae bacterium G1746]|uniref:hypothetical protein n=1 Tax=Aestuariimicrobium sp. G57 TaxID=3418485 RepID=UPI003C1EE3AD
MSLSIETGQFFDSRMKTMAGLAKQVLVNLVSDTPDEQVLGFALYTDAVATSLEAAVYRRTDHDANLATARRRFGDDDADSFAEAHTDWDAYLRWAPVEWPRNTTAAPLARIDALDDLWTTLREHRARVSNVDQRYWPSVMHEMAAAAMIILYRDGWFRGYPHAVQVVEVFGADDETGVDRGTRRRWTSQMNTDADTLRWAASHRSR